MERHISHLPSNTRNHISSWIEHTTAHEILPDPMELDGNTSIAATSLSSRPTLSIRTYRPSSRSSSQSRKKKPSDSRPRKPEQGHADYSKLIRSYRNSAAPLASPSRAEIHPSIKEALSEYQSNFYDYTGSGKKSKIKINLNANEPDKAAALNEITTKFYAASKAFINKSPSMGNTNYTMDEVYIGSHSQSEDLILNFSSSVKNRERSAIKTYIVSKSYNHCTLTSLDKQYDHLIVLQLQAAPMEFISADGALKSLLTSKDQLLIRSTPEYPKNHFLAADLNFVKCQYLIAFGDKAIPHRHSSFPKTMTIRVLNSDAFYYSFCLSTHHTRTKCPTAPRCSHCGNTSHDPRFCKA